MPNSKSTTSRTRRHTTRSITGTTSTKIRTFDRSRMKYNRIRTMNQILDIYESRPGEFVPFESIAVALAPTHRINIYQAHADTRRLGLRQFITKEDDLRFQYSTSTQ